MDLYFQHRLEQSGLLLALCEKHNEYPPLFQKLKDLQLEELQSPDSGPLYEENFDPIRSLLDTTDVAVTSRNTKDLGSS
jgi:hypothetical protein